MIAFSSIAGVATGHQVLPGGETAARARHHVIERELTRRQNHSTVLATVTVTKQDVLTRKGAGLMRDTAVFKQADDRRHRDAQQGSMQNGALLFLSLGHAFENQDKRAASPTDIDRLV